MQVRMIDDTPFIVTSHGKRETIQTPAEARQTEQREIDVSKANIQQLDETAVVIRQRLESELIDGIDTSATRQELAAIDEEIHGLQRDLDSANKRLKSIDVMLDQHAAAKIKEAADCRLSRTYRPL